MATIQDRAFSREYRGLRNQLGVGGFLATVCLIGYEYMRRKRRGAGLTGKGREEGVGSVETWEFGYLYQGRCWAKKPSPALPKGPLTWVKQALRISESTLPELLGIDATLYIRFLRGCWSFAALHTCTTFPVLFSLHVIYSPSSIPMKSMDKASVSSLVQSKHGLRLLFVHVIIAFWIAITWILTLLWVARGLFRYRALVIQAKAEELAQMPSNSLDREKAEGFNHGLRLRTVMVTNVPVQLRSDKALKEYFEYYMSRPLGTAPISPGFLLKMMTFLFNRVAASAIMKHFKTVPSEVVAEKPDTGGNKLLPVIVERVVVARKMTELASLLDRRQDIIKKLEYAHIKLACKALQAARAHLAGPATKTDRLFLAQIKSWQQGAGGATEPPDAETSVAAGNDPMAQLNLVAETLAPFVSEFKVPPPAPLWRILLGSRSAKPTPTVPIGPHSRTSASADASRHETVWDALHALPREFLDAYQPLINLNRLFRGHAVPAIDYYTAKLGLLTALINENRGRALDAYPPSSTVFVTFEKIEDARRAAKYLQAHPRNPMACLVVPAPDVADLDWVRVMKSSFTGEFLKDWVVGLGVWTFTCSWVIPISFLVGLVNLENLSLVIPPLRTYLQKNPDREAISTLLPTILVSILTILIPVLLLLIAKKAFTIITYSKLHDAIMIRYWRFLVCNLLVFFCVGVAALESFLQSFKHKVNLIPLIASSFPSAGPFYVGWLILQTSIHGFLELGLYGLPLILYPATKAATTLRRRAACTRPRTFNFYYWLPNHALIMTIGFCFALLNPLVLPFLLLYFSVESVIVKHQLIHVYAKTYDNNGKLILIRIMRYSLDGLMLGQVVFLAFLLVLQETAEAVLMAILLGLTVIMKIAFTHLCRAKFAELDRAEDHLYSREGVSTPRDITGDGEGGADDLSRMATLGSFLPHGSSHFWTWKLPPGVYLSYTSLPARPQRTARRAANPFGPTSSFPRVSSSRIIEEPAEGKITRNAGDMTIHPQESTTLRTDGEFQPQFGLSPEEMSQLLHTRHNTAANAGKPQLPLVTAHAKRANWDDVPRLDSPYENPFYAAPVDKFLWLPRNPFGVLDLDDSVDLHQAITSEPGAGKLLGQWMAGTVASELTEPAPSGETPGSAPSPAPNPPESVRDGLPFRMPRQLSGTEEISLSRILSARVNRIEQEDDVDQATPHRSSSGRSSYFERAASLGRPGIFSRRQTNVSSISNRSPHTFPGRSMSGLSAGVSFQQQVDQQPSPSGVHDPVNQPDVQAQAAFMELSLPTSMSIATQASTRSSSRRVEKSSGPPVPIREAVVGEVIAEEQIEAMDRVRREEEERRFRESRKPSWWNAWFWHRSRHHVDTGVPPESNPHDK